jgi:hypothetical protein
MIAFQFQVNDEDHSIVVDQSSITWYWTVLSASGTSPIDSSWIESSWTASGIWKDWSTTIEKKRKKERKKERKKKKQSDECTWNKITKYKEKTIEILALNVLHLRIVLFHLQLKILSLAIKIFIKIWNCQSQIINITSVLHDLIYYP